MTEQKTSKLDTKLEIVEAILAKLYINGSVKEGRLQKKVLYKMTNDYIRIKKIAHFTHKDMSGAMLQHGFCYYMEKEQAHKSKFFNVNTAAIGKLAEKYPRNNFLDESPEVSEGENCEEFDFTVKYVLTTELKQNQTFVFSDKSCIVCMETFDDQRMFECHMKRHGKEFLVRKTHNSWPQMINLKAVFQQEEGKFVFEIKSHEDDEDEEITITRIFLVLSEDNDFHEVKIYPQGNSVKFDIHCDIFSTENHPYSILVLFTLNRTISLVTQYHFKLNKLLCSNDIDDDAIKERNKSNIPKHIKRMVFEQLPSYYPSKEMKSLSKKKFAENNLTQVEKSLLSVISDLLKDGIRQKTYVSFWKTLIEMEDCAAEEQYAKITKTHQKLKFSQGFYILSIPNLSELTPAIVEWTKITIAPSDQPKKKVIGRVYQVRKNDVVLDIEEHLNLKALYNVRFLTNRLTIQLEREALQYVALHKISSFFFPAILPNHHFEQYEFEWINESVKTNPEQQSAIINIVGKASFPAPYILMGPPGTGKTTTIVEAICQILRQNPYTNILVSASSNYACNVITHRLLKHLPETSIFRMFAGSKEAEFDSIDHELVKISNLRFGSHYYPHLDELTQYNVVLTTLSVAGRFAQAKISCAYFSYVFIDESGSSTEPSTLVPIAGVISSKNNIHGQIILAGDPKQLGPIVISDTAMPHLGVSLLERLIDTGIYARDPNTRKYNPRAITKLIRNFRSHPKILEFPNKKFYSGELLAKGSPDVTHWACNWKYLPNQSIPILFEHVFGESEQDDNSSSWYNKREVKRVIFYIRKIMRERKAFGREIEQKDIGVITPYKKQCQKIMIECKRKNWVDIDVGSVEKFQGQEKPVIILSTVRSLTRGVGFLNNPKRLNVALTRAQALLIVIGNVDTLQMDPMWNEFIGFCKNNKLMKQIEEENEAVKVKGQVGKARRAKKAKTPDKVMQPSKQMKDLPFLPDVPKDTTRQSSESDNFINVRHNLVPHSINLTNMNSVGELRGVPSIERPSSLSRSPMGSSSHGNDSATTFRPSVTRQSNGSGNLKNDMHNVLPLSERNSKEVPMASSTERTTPLFSGNSMESVANRNSDFPTTLRFIRPDGFNPSYGSNISSRYVSNAAYRSQSNPTIHRKLKKESTCVIM